MQIKQLIALREICTAIIEAVEECGHTGAPAGVLYSVLSSQGCNKSQFDSLMRGLVATGYLRKIGLVYFSSGKPIGAAPVAAPVGLPPRVEVGKEQSSAGYVDGWTRAAVASGSPIPPAMGRGFA